MNRQDWDILCYVEEHWTLKEEFPTPSLISQKTGYPQELVVESLFKDVVKKAMGNRGIAAVSSHDDRLTPEQIACINTLLNVSDQRTLGQKLSALGIHPSTYKGWKKQRHFMEAMRAEGEKLFGETMPEVHTSLMNKALEGDVNALKLYYAMAGRWDDKRSVESLNIRFVMLKLLEVIQKHVQDKNTLEAIASEFDGLLSDQRAIQ